VARDSFFLLEELTFLFLVCLSESPLDAVPPSVSLREIWLCEDEVTIREELDGFIWALRFPTPGRVPFAVSELFVDRRSSSRSFSDEFAPAGPPEPPFLGSPSRS